MEPDTPTSATSFSTAAFRDIDGTNHLLYVRMLQFKESETEWLHTANTETGLTSQHSCWGAIYAENKEVSNLPQALQQ